RRRHTRSLRDWSSDVCSSDLLLDRSLWYAGDREGGAPVSAVADLELHVEPGQCLELTGSGEGPGIDRTEADRVEQVAKRLPRVRSEERRVGKECKAGGGR